MGQVVSIVLSVYLNHKRRSTDRERRYFYAQMREKNGLPKSDHLKFLEW